MAFQKGQSGNPAGRPRKRLNGLRATEEFLAAADPSDSERRPRGLVVLEKLYRRGIYANKGEGDVRALQELMERWLGKSVARVEMEVRSPEEHVSNILEALEALDGPGDKRTDDETPQIQ